jgi:hypothetical protein
VTWRRRNLQGEVMAVEQVEDDGYDPRGRPWYRGAVSSRKLHWSDIYIFFTDQKPGITVSLPIIADDGELRGVLGLDIALEQLSAFLASLKIGHSGRAMIIDEAGRLVAYPDLARMLTRVGENLQPARLDELGDPVLTRAFNRLQVEGHGDRLEFRLGMDTGVVIGSPVGRGEGSYNLWGEAVRAAQWMAETGLAGCIQGTESTYRRLRDSYLFTVRGTYYLRDVGELSTYIVTGRL